MPYVDLRRTIFDNAIKKLLLLFATTRRGVNNIDNRFSKK